MCFLQFIIIIMHCVSCQCLYCISFPVKVIETTPLLVLIGFEIYLCHVCYTDFLSCRFCITFIKYGGALSSLNVP